MPAQRFGCGSAGDFPATGFDAQVAKLKADYPFLDARLARRLTRLYGIPGKLPSAVRRFGMALTGRIGPLKDRLAAEARGTSGDLPLLLRGLPI